MNRNQVSTAIIKAMSGCSIKIGEPVADKVTEGIAGLFPKFEQIAFHTTDINATKRAYQALGCKTWVDDLVTAKGLIGIEQNSQSHRGETKEEVNVAKLSFNYELGTELELIHYQAGNNWHAAAGRTGSLFLSHMSYHVDCIFSETNRLQKLGFSVIQAVETVSHTNDHLLKIGRKYKYTIFDTRNELGFDVKLIQRVEAAN